MEKNIASQLGILLEIQDLDIKIHSIEESIAEIPRKLKETEETLDNTRKQIKKFKKDIEKAIVERKNKELELESNQGTIRKYQSQLYNVKTNKEYASLLHEIEELKRQNSVLEDGIIELMEKVESGEELLNKKKKELEEEEQNYQEKVEEGNKNLEELKKKREQLEHKKAELSPSISSSLLARYNRLIKAKGMALVPVINGTCGGCHMELPPQVLNEVKSGKRLVACERCSRILYQKEP